MRNLDLTQNESCPAEAFREAWLLKQSNMDAATPRVDCVAMRPGRCVGALQMVPAISISDGLPNQYAPLAMIIIVDMVVMAMEDLAKHRGDRRTNQQTTSILSGQPGSAANPSGTKVTAQKPRRINFLNGVSTSEMVSEWKAYGPFEMRKISKAPYQSPKTRRRALMTASNDSIAATTADKTAVEWREGTWADVKVGDIVRVRNREAFPADLLLLHSSSGPQCWVNTKPLDGETDIKLRVAPPAVTQLFGDFGAASDPPASELRRRLGGQVALEEPNDKVNDVTAELWLAASSSPALLNEESCLLRGCQLRNTDWVLGLVLECGPETKSGFKGKNKRERLKAGHSTSMVNAQVRRRSRDGLPDRPPA